MKCAFCGSKATILCDSHLGWERKRNQIAADAPNLLVCAAWGVPLRYRHVHTCDTPLCSACVVTKGGMHIRLRHSGSFTDSIDYCPGHDFGDLRTEITGLHADAMRAKWRAAARAHQARNKPNVPQIGLFEGART